jgi:hypothetical protein
MKKRLINFWQRIKSCEHKEDVVATTLFVLGILGFVPGPIPYIKFLTDAYHEIRTELIGIGITVLIIDNLIEARGINEEKKRLILQMGSPNNEFAIEAVRQLRSRGWLYDGTTSKAFLNKTNLHGADLKFAILSKAKLRDADLSKTNIRHADLSESDLGEADLSGFDIFGANLSGTFLHKANLSKASLLGLISGGLISNLLT